MTPASIRFAVVVLSLFVAAPAALRAGDPNPFGGSLGGLDEKKIRDDFSKLRQQIEQPQEEMRRKNTGARFHRWTRSGSRRSARDSAGAQNAFRPLPGQLPQKLNSSSSPSR